MSSVRKLTTIMFTDIVGYTSLSSQDEQNALDLLDLNAKLHSFLIERFNGLKLKEIGDGTLATFDSAIDAANCAIALQQYVSHYNKFKLRIGLHVGDVLACSNDVLGNSVNISARIQGATNPESIAISDVFYQSICNQNVFSFKDLGEVYLKGILQPFKLYELLYAPITPKPIDFKKLTFKKNKPKKIHYYSIAIIIATLLSYFFHPLFWDQKPSKISSIAVLPFKDLTVQQDQKYFSDGISEELLNALSKINGLKVASRLSSFGLFDEGDSLTDVGNKLNVSHLLQGGVQRSDNKMRISAQLTDVYSGTQIWAETYDRQLSDIFTIQDDIALSVVAALENIIVHDVLSPLPQVTMKNFVAYDYYLQGLSYLNAPKNQNNLLLAKQYFEKAIVEEPTYASAYAGVCRVEVNNYLVHNSNKDIIAATSTCIKSLELDPTLIEVHIALGKFHHSTGRFNNALSSFTKALNISPANSMATIGLADTYISLNQTEKAESLLLDLTNSTPNLWTAYNELGRLYLLEGDTALAIEQFKKVIKIYPDNVSAYSNLGYAYFYLNDYPNANKYWNITLNHEKSADTYSNLGMLYYQQSMFIEAEKMFLQAVELSPDLALFLGNLADVYYHSSQPDKALTTYRKAIKKAESSLDNNSKDIMLLSTLALYSARIGAFDKAKIYIDTSLQVSPNEINVLYYAALVYFELDKPDIAWAHLSNAVSGGYPHQLIKSSPDFKNQVNDVQFDSLTQRAPVALSTKENL